jgi:hypothetical protein
MLAQSSTVRAATIITLLGALCLLLALFFGYQFKSQRSAFFAHAQRHATLELTSAHALLRDQLRAITDIGNTFAQELSAENADQEKILVNMQQRAATLPYATTIGVAYEQYALGKGIRFFAREYVKTGQVAQSVLLEKFYDYTGASWFNNGMSSGKRWSDPYFSVVLNAVVVTYCVAIQHFDKNTRISKNIGLVFIELTLSDIAKLAELLNLKYTTREFILARDGRFLFHPIKAYVDEAKTIFDVAHEPGHGGLGDIGDHMVHNEQGHNEYYDTTAHKDFWVYYSPVEHTGWSLGLMIEKNNSWSASESLKRTVILAMLFFVLSLFFLILLLSRAYEGEDFGIWTSSTSFSILMLFFISFICYLVLTEPRSTPPNSTVISDRSDLQRFLRLQTKINQQEDKPVAAIIPTNLYITSIAFLKKGTVIIDGFIWQTYDKVKHKDIVRNVQIANSSKYIINQAYRSVSGNYETIGYRFSTEIDPQFDVLKYPFDRQTIKILLVHPDIEKNIVLVPDFDTWDSSRLRANLGLADSIDISGWVIEKTFFSYTMTNYSADFGIDHFVRLKDFPNLEFNVFLQRTIFDPLINGLLSVIIVLVLLFGSLLVAAPVNQKPASLETLLGLSTTIFFSTVVSHQRFKGIVPSVGEISYIEYFYFMCYAFILLVMFNSYVTRLTLRFNFLRAKNSIGVKVAYWPMVTLSITILTLIIFY